MTDGLDSLEYYMVNYTMFKCANRSTRIGVDQRVDKSETSFGM